MDANRLALVLRSLTASRSRRTVLGVTLGGPAMLRRPTQAEAANRKKRKKNPCKGKADDASCKGDGRCLSGDCNPKPACLPFGADCSTNQDGCCTACFGSPGEPLRCLGGMGKAGDACQSDDECNGHVGFICVGYLCMSSCPAISDFCADGATSCGSEGLCFRPKGGGDARCGASAGVAGTCGCKSHAECQTKFGVGSFCVTISGDFCSCGDGLTTFCAIPK